MKAKQFEEKFDANEDVTSFLDIAKGRRVLQLQGTIIPGHGVASGTSSASPYPQGSIAMQAPFFKARGLDLTGLHLGTLNVSIAPATFKITRPAFRFDNVKWTDLHPPETFSFVACEVIFGGVTSNGWLYYRKRPGIPS